MKRYYLINTAPNKLECYAKSYMAKIGIAYYRMLQLVHITQYAIVCNTKYGIYVM